VAVWVSIPIYQKEHLSSLPGKNSQGGSRGEVDNGLSQASPFGLRLLVKCGKLCWSIEEKEGGKTGKRVKGGLRQEIFMELGHYQRAQLEKKRKSKKVSRLRMVRCTFCPCEPPSRHQTSVAEIVRKGRAYLSRRSKPWSFSKMM